MRDIKLRKLRPEDFDKLLIIIEDAKKFMRQFDMDQWQNGYPDRSTLERFLRLEVCYVADDLSAMIAIFPMDEDYLMYEDILKNYAVLHTFCVKKELRGTDYAMRFFKEVITLLKKMGYDYVGIDTHSKNLAMLRFIEKNHFLPLGEVYIGGTDKRLSFYKKIAED